MAWDDGYYWLEQSDAGNQGDFGGADYIAALNRGGTSREELMATRQAVQNWMRTDPRGREGGHGGIDWTTRSAFWGGEPGDSGQSRIRDFVMSGTGVGESRYGNIRSEQDRGWGDNEGRGWYTEDDWRAGLSMGQTNEQIRNWLMSEEGRQRIRSEGDQSDILQRVQREVDQQTRESHLEDLATGESALRTVQQERDTARSNYAALEDRFTGELQQLRSAANQVRSSAPSAVVGGSALGIRQAQRSALPIGTLSGLTRPSPSNKLRVQTLNI